MLSFEADWNMAANAMETDDVTHLPSNTLRRSSSAPNVSAAVINDHVPAFQPIQKSRERRFSTSQVAVNVGSPASRIAQLIKEASIDDISREIQGESEMLLVKDIHECFSLEDHDKNHDTDMHDRRNSFDEPCMAFPSSASSSPSPTRFNHKPVPIRNTRSLTPPGASPTRQTFIRRSMSPILNLRPSSLQTIKRKGSDGFEPGVSPAKRPRDETSALTCSPEGPCETAHLQFDDDSNIHEEHHSSSASDSPLSSSITPMLFGNTHRPHLPVYRSRFTPPRSPLAGPSTTQGPSAPPRTIGNSPSCFTFAPVRD